MNIVVVGAGYVGLVAALGYAKFGHRVACVDKDTSKIAQLDLGEAPFFEPGLPEVLREMQEAGRIVFTPDLAGVIGNAEVVMIAVGTPSKSDGSADLAAVYAVADEIGLCLKHETLIVMKSTVPVGTNRAVLERLRVRLREAGRDALSGLVDVASCPEFLREGSALADFFKPDRIVIGAQDDTTRATVERLHEGIAAPRVVMSLESAELTKYAANAFLSTKISFINEIANVASRVGADVRDVARAIGMDRRIGSAFLQAGIGYGGSCFPKDVSALHQMSGAHGYAFKLLAAAIEVNNRQRELFFARVESALGGLQGRQIAVWGLAFKAGTDDVRESVAVDIVLRLFARGAEVKVYDPKAMANAARAFSKHIAFASTAVDACAGAEAVLVLTDWPEFREVSFEVVHQNMLEPRIFDGRNLLADLKLGSRGFLYEGIGCV